MITQVPTSTQFQDQGVDYLNLAWEGTMEILVRIFDYEEQGGETFDTKEVWSNAQRTLGTSLLLAHQGCDLLLKGQIASISPYLLISGEVRNWPKINSKGDISFEDIRSVDSQDLIKLHDYVFGNKLTNEFKMQHTNLRKQRNKLAHSASNSLQFTSKEILKIILEVSNELLLQSNWFESRRRYLPTNVEGALYGGQWDEYVIAREAVIVAKELDRKDLIRYFNFDKRRRKYLCPNCVRSSDWDYFEDARLALLDPNTPKSKAIYCFACGQITKVHRKNCTQEDCRGNVITEDEELCLTCFEEQER